MINRRAVRSASVGLTLALAGLLMATPIAAQMPTPLDPFLDSARGLRSSADGAAPGYVLFNPGLSRTIYLVDVDGQVVHTWDTPHRGAATYLLDNGNLLRTAGPNFVPLRVGGQSGAIQEFTWDGELVWDFVLANDEYLLHHDIAPLPNGNILAIAWEMMATEQGRADGHRPDRLVQPDYWPEAILELERRGSNDANIVWEWHSRDHSIQDFDPEAVNYGVVAEHPELIDINAAAEPLSDDELEEMLSSGTISLLDPEVDTEAQDVLHFNAISYNPELDQIVFSSPYLSEIFVIDHSTTTAEAAGSSGGRYGKGGDILFRWGNPANYDRGDAADKRLFGQHHPRWTEPGLPGAGNITVFNNNFTDADGTSSAVFELVPPLNNQGGYVLAEGGTYGPAEPVWRYRNLEEPSFWSFFISGAHRLPNGNTFIDSGARGRYFEGTPEGEVVWEYWTPFAGIIENEQDEMAARTIAPYLYLTFRATKLPPDHPGLADRNLAPLDPQPDPQPYPEFD